MSKKYDLPAMPWYVGDWLKCPEVRALPPDYRGLWFDLICYMWESTERGVMIKPNGQPYSDNDIIRMVGLDNQNTGIWLTSLLDNGVCDRRDDGAIYSKRMVRDEEIRKIRREVGLKGGNPKLLVNQISNQKHENEDVIGNTSSIQPKTAIHIDTKYDFESLWLKYPRKLGKHDATLHFKAQVKTDQDYADINKALDNFLQSSQITQGDPKFIPHGSTWFNNRWRDWIDFKEVEIKKVDDNGVPLEFCTKKPVR
jgi:hypothetical protein